MSLYVLIPVGVDVSGVEECLGVLVPVVDVDDSVGGVGGVAGVALYVVRQPVQGRPLSQQVVEAGRQVLVPRHYRLDELSKRGHWLVLSVEVVFQEVIVVQQVLVEHVIVLQNISSVEDESISREKSLVGVSDLYGFQVVFDLLDVVQVLLALCGVGETSHEVPPGLTPSLVRDTDADLVLLADLEHLSLGRKEEEGLGVLTRSVRVVRGLYLVLESPAGRQHGLHLVTGHGVDIIVRHREIDKHQGGQCDPGQPPSLADTPAPHHLSSCHIAGAGQADSVQVQRGEHR